MQKKILIRGVNWVGDAVMTMPAIRAVRAAFPHSHISLLVKPWVAPLFERDPNINEIIPYMPNHEGFSGKFRLASEIKAKGFDTALLLQNAFDAAASAFLSHIPERIGYSRDMRSMLLTKAIPCEGLDRSAHHIDYYLELLRRAGISFNNRMSPWVYLDIEERIAARKRLAGLRRPVIGLNPGAKFGSAKMWLPERFAEVGRWVINELGGSVVVFGGPGETGTADEIMARIGEIGDSEYALSLAGKTSLRELCGLISECDLLLTNDSGPMHIGYAVGTPLVSIFGSTSPELTGPPVNAQNIVLRQKTGCSPCFKRTCPKPDIPCMKGIGAGMAIDAIRRIVPTKPRQAIFLDRDGTLCEDAHYLSTWDKLKVFNDISQLNGLIDKGFMLIGITNQSGIARGIVKEDFVREVNDMFLKKHRINAFYYCPHLPDEHCSCRKPEPGMLHMARMEHRIDLKRSFIIGDKDADMLLAKAVGAHGIHVKTGQQALSEHADHSCASLAEAVAYILNSLQHANNKA